MKFQKRDIQSGDGKNDKFLKLKDGESKNIILRGEVYEFWMKWVNGKSVTVQKQDPEAKSRFKINALIYEEGRFKATIWEFPVTVYNQLADVAAEYPLERTKIKLSRQGTGTDTVYHILPLVSEKDKLSPQVLAQIEAVSLNILDTQHPSPSGKIFPKDEDDGGFGDPPPESYDEIPF